VNSRHERFFCFLSDSFRSKENLSKMSEFRLSPEQASEAGAVDRRFQYIKGSVHQNTLDAPFVFQVKPKLKLRFNFVA
jgi:hypothetical protein